MLSKEEKSKRVPNVEGRRSKSEKRARRQIRARCRESKKKKPVFLFV